ncbi:hypothetical protein HYW35_01440 [Candidatus Saccharibacteria bacterium]|nr:hypothetical protein [Candidatus Saccharibacteria bacterium]
MLDFLLVLGQIPGTNIQLDFWEFILVIVAIWYGIRLWRRPATRRRFMWRLKQLALWLVFPFMSLYRHH